MTKHITQFEKRCSKAKHSCDVNKPILIITGIFFSIAFGTLMKSGKIQRQISIHLPQHICYTVKKTMMRELSFDYVFADPRNAMTKTLVSGHIMHIEAV